MLLSVVVKTVKRKTHRGSQSLTTDQITDDIIQCVNESIREVQKLLPKRYWFKQSTIAVTSGVAGTAAVYSLPSDTQDPILFHYTVNGALYKLNKISSDEEWFRGVWNPQASTNLPHVYREIGPNSSTGYKQIELFPIPNQSITLNIEYYKKKGSDLTTSNLASEIPDIPDEVQDVVEKGAVYKFLKGFDDPGTKEALLDFEKAMIAMNVNEDEDSDKQPAFRFSVPAYNTPHFKLD